MADTEAGLNSDLAAGCPAHDFRRARPPAYMCVLCPEYNPCIVACKTTLRADGRVCRLLPSVTAGDLPGGREKRRRGSLLVSRATLPFWRARGSTWMDACNYIPPQCRGSPGRTRLGSWRAAMCCPVSPFRQFTYPSAAGLPRYCLLRLPCSPP